MSISRAIVHRAFFLFILALVIRVLFVLNFSSQPLFQANFVSGTDMEFLIRWAQRIAAGDILSRGIGVFWWAPAFPYCLAFILQIVGLGNFIGAAVVQAVLSACTTALIYFLGRRLLGDEKTAVLAGAFAAFYAPAIFYTAVFLSTTLEILLSVGILYAVTLARNQPRLRTWFVAGIISGLGCLARPNFLLGIFTLICAIPFLLPLRDRRLDWPALRRAWIGFLAGILIVVAPVTIRNGAVGGRFILISAAGPETFRIANSYDSTPMNFVYPQQPRMPLTSEAFWRHQGRKALLFWSGLEVPQNVSYYLGREESWVLSLPLISFWVAVPLAAVGLWSTRHKARDLLHVYLFLGAYYLSVVAFFIIARWRLPLIVPLLVFSAAGLRALLRGLMERSWKSVGLKTVGVCALALAIYPWKGPYVFAADHGQLGYILANGGNYDQAAVHLSQAADGFPQSGALQRDLGRILLRLGRAEEARAHLERAAVLLPNDLATHRALGWLLAGIPKEFERARFHLGRFVQLSPHGVESAEAHEYLLLRGKTGGAP